MAYLKIKNFKKAYGDKIIFEDINFSAKKGEFITLLGPSIKPLYKSKSFDT